MLRNCDAYGDGALDEFELTVFFELEPDWIQPLTSNPNLKPAAAAAAMIRRWDRNRDGQLQDIELAAAMAQRHFFNGRSALSLTNRPVHNETQPTSP
jgi:hypothetical protein